MTLTYGAPILDANGKAIVSGHRYTPQHDSDPAKTYAFQQARRVDGVALPVYRFELLENDWTYFDTKGDRNRSELCLAGEAGAPYLTEQWFSFSVRFGPGKVQGWQVWKQFHEAEKGLQPAGVPTMGSPPFALESGFDGKGHEFIHARGRSSANYAAGGDVFGSNVPLVRDVWRPVVGCVVFDNAGSRGSICLWLDKKVWVAKTGLRLGYDGQTATPYDKFGLYRQRVASSQAIEFANYEFAVGRDALHSRIAAPLPIP